MSEPGEVAYQAYSAAVNNTTDDGVTLPPWAELPGAVLAPFRSAAEAAQAYQPPTGDRDGSETE